MKQEDTNNSFTYAYSAAQQEEIRAIRQKYLPPQEDPMAQLRRLDESTTRKGTVVALCVGVMGTLVMGAGMSLCMVWGGLWFVPGILLGLLGMAAAAVAYPLYNRITEREKQRLAPQILKLTEQLLK